MSSIVLSEKQQEALDKFNKNYNVFITGPGGTGKTALIKNIVRDGENNGKIVQVCAMTGCATVLLGCKNTKTLHSWAGIGLGNGTINDIIKRIVRNRKRRQNWLKTDVLIVDEVSMMSKKMFDLLDILGKTIRKIPTRPFGGIQLVFSGDFYQLPPVPDQLDISGGKPANLDSGAFCFESHNWAKTWDFIVQLSIIFRQTDKTYIKILNQIRVGKLSKKSYNALCARTIVNTGNNFSEKLRPPILLPRRQLVDQINQLHLNSLKGERRTYKTETDNSLPIKKDELPDIYEATVSIESIKYEIQHLKNNIRVEETLELIEGTHVLCVANIDLDSPTPVVNGSQGKIIGFESGLPLVQFRDGHTRTVGYHVWRSDAIPGLGVKQIPLIPAWAITIHKAQGMSLDAAEIDAGVGIFECGQTYVALSRVKSLDGLYLTSFDPNKIKVNRKVQEYYKSITAV